MDDRVGDGRRARGRRGQAPVIERPARSVFTRAERRVIDRIRIPTLIITAEVPNMDEITVWLGLVAPKGTPAAIIDKLQAQVAKTLADPAIKAKADAAGLFPAASTPAEFSAFIRKEAQRWSAVVKETGMKYD